MLCAAAAGDSATAKAVLLASEVRKMDHLRTIGGSRPDALEHHRDSEVQLDSGTTPTMDAGTTNDNSNPSDVVVTEGRLKEQNRKKKQIVTFGEREYGKDTRVISALVHSCAQAVNKNGVGTMWAGRENLGYLCENSLRLITTRWEPSYRDTSVPGISSTKVGIGALHHVDEREKEYEYTPGKRKKFRGLFLDEDELTTIDDIQTEDDFNPDDDGDDFFVGENRNQDTERKLGNSMEVKGDNTEEVSALCIFANFLCHFLSDFFGFFPGCMLESGFFSFGQSLVATTIHKVPLIFLVFCL